MSDLVGLDAYTPAPPPMDRPAWVVATGDLWARLDGDCLPAVLEDANGGGIEITTCDRGLFTCGVAVAANDLLMTSHAWCRDDTHQVVEPWTGRVLSLSSADDEAVVWRQVVQLSAVPVGLKVESQECTASSLRALKKHDKQVERTKEGDTPPEWPGVRPVYGNRVCVHVEGFEVSEGALSDTTLLGDFDVHTPTEPGKVDCRETCPVDQLAEFAGAIAQVRDKWFHPPGATTIALYRTEEACRMESFVEPSGAPASLCGSPLAAGLRR